MTVLWGLTLWVIFCSAIAYAQNPSSSLTISKTDPNQQTPGYVLTYRISFPKDVPSSATTAAVPSTDTLPQPTPTPRVFSEEDALKHSVTVLWTLPNQQKLTIPLRWVDGGTWATRVNLKDAAGSHRLILMDLGPSSNEIGEQGDGLVEQVYSLSLPGGSLVLESTRNLGGPGQQQTSPTPTPSITPTTPEASSLPTESTPSTSETLPTTSTVSSNTSDTGLGHAIEDDFEETSRPTSSISPILLLLLGIGGFLCLVAVGVVAFFVFRNSKKTVPQKSSSENDFVSPFEVISSVSRGGTEASLAAAPSTIEDPLPTPTAADKAAPLDSGDLDDFSSLENFNELDYASPEDMVGSGFDMNEEAFLQGTSAPEDDIFDQDRLKQELGLGSSLAPEFSTEPLIEPIVAESTLASTTIEDEPPTQLAADDQPMISAENAAFDQAMLDELLGVTSAPSTKETSPLPTIEITPDPGLSSASDIEFDQSMLDALLASSQPQAESLPPDSDAVSTAATPAPVSSALVPEIQKEELSALDESSADAPLDDMLEEAGVEYLPDGRIIFPQRMSLSQNMLEHMIEKGIVRTGEDSSADHSINVMELTSGSTRPTASSEETDDKPRRLFPERMLLTQAMLDQMIEEGVVHTAENIQPMEAVTVQKMMDQDAQVSTSELEQLRHEMEPPNIPDSGPLDQSMLDALIAEQSSALAPEPSSASDSSLASLDIPDGPLDQSMLDALLAEHSSNVEPSASSATTVPVDLNVLDGLEDLDLDALLQQTKEPPPSS